MSRTSSQPCKRSGTQRHDPDEQGRGDPVDRQSEEDDPFVQLLTLTEEFVDCIQVFQESVQQLRKEGTDEHQRCDQASMHEMACPSDVREGNRKETKPFNHLFFGDPDFASHESELPASTEQRSYFGLLVHNRQGGLTRMTQNKASVRTRDAVGNPAANCWAEVRKQRGRN